MKGLSLLPRVTPQEHRSPGITRTVITAAGRPARSFLPRVAPQDTAPIPSSLNSSLTKEKSAHRSPCHVLLAGGNGASASSPHDNA
jgi:hypothetical protein